MFTFKVNLEVEGGYSIIRPAHGNSRIILPFWCKGKREFHFTPLQSLLCRKMGPLQKAFNNHFLTHLHL